MWIVQKFFKVMTSVKSTFQGCKIFKINYDDLSFLSAIFLYLMMNVGSDYLVRAEGSGYWVWRKNTASAREEDNNHLDAVSVGVEGSAVVELQDDEREGVRLRHLLVIVWGPHLVRHSDSWQWQWASYCLYFYFAVESVVCAAFPQTRNSEGVQSNDQMNYWWDVSNRWCVTWCRGRGWPCPGTSRPSLPSRTHRWGRWRCWAWT